MVILVQGWVFFLCLKATLIFVTYNKPVCKKNFSMFTTEILKLFLNNFYNISIENIFRSDQ